MILRLKLHAAGGVHHCLGHRECLLSVTLEGSLGHLQECFLDGSTIKSGGLVEEHVIVFAGPLLAARGSNLTFGLLIELVADADEGEGLRVLRPGILVEAIPPAAERLEGLLVGDVVAKGAAIGTAVESVAERLELLLAGRIPNLERHHCVVY